jgi:hypothetical protein
MLGLDGVTFLTGSEQFHVKATEVFEIKDDDESEE